MWILFDGEEEGGTVGEEGSTWSNVRLGIRKMDIEGKDASSRGKQDYRARLETTNGLAGSEREADAVIGLVTCTVYRFPSHSHACLGSHIASTRLDFQL